MSYIEKLKGFNDRIDYRHESQQLLDLMKPTLDGPVLDIGCGLGGMINTLRNCDVNVFGVDPSFELLQELAYKKTALSYGENLPFKNDVFSAIYYMHSIAHLQDTPRSLAEARRVLKEDGTIFVITPNLQFENVIRPAKTVLRKIGKYSPDDTVVGHLSPKELNGLLSDQFNVIHMSTFGKLGFQRIIAAARQKSI